MRSQFFEVGTHVRRDSLGEPNPYLVQILQTERRARIASYVKLTIPKCWLDEDYRGAQMGYP